MSASLYRKYRPDSFDQVIGQSFVKQTIQNEIKSNKLAHAYLFSGPRGVGKTTLARLIAKAVNCENRKDGESEPCGKCTSCINIAKNKNLDMIEVDAASNRGIDEIRELRERTRFAPATSKFKIFIIDEVHMLTKEAFNALLKTLEEPPAYIIFILATTEVHKIPETIISRCQRFDFKKIDFKDIVERLDTISKSEGYTIAKEALQNIAYHSEGHPRDAESLLSQALAIAGDKKEIGLEELLMIMPASNFGLIFQFIEFLIKSDIKNALELINKLVDDGIDLENFTENLIKMIHKFILIKAGLNNLDWQLEKTLEAKADELVRQVSNVQLVFMIEAFSQAKSELNNFLLNQIALEIAVLKICTDDVEIKPSAEKVNNIPDSAQEIKVEQKLENNEVEPKSQEVVEIKKVEKVESIESVKKVDNTNDAEESKDIENEQEEVKEATEDKNESKVSLYEIKGKWIEILQKIGQENRSLVAMMEVSEIKNYENKVLTISFPYKFYIDKIKDMGNNKLIEDVVFKVLNCRIKIKAELGEKKEASLKFSPAQEKAPQKAPDPKMNTLLEAFGGEVV